MLGSATLVELLRIRSDLEAGRTRLDRLDLATIRRDGLEATLTGAADQLADAHRRAEDSPVLRIAGIVPVVSTQVNALRDLTEVADSLGGLAREAGTHISTALDAASADPAARVTMLDVVTAELDRIEAAVATIDLGAEGPLLPPLGSARNSVETSLASVQPRFADLRSKVGALRALLAGPSQYLITVGNNAEMRAGAGMPLSAGLATITNGDIGLGEFKSTVSEMVVTTPGGAFNTAIDERLANTYARWALCCSMPETAVSPNFPVTGPLYADIAFDSQGWRVDGVVHVDALALAALLEVVGPVDVDGVQYTAETTPQLVLNQPYFTYDTIEARDNRIEAQSKLAQVLFEAIKTRDVDLLDLIASLQTSATGRHLMVWSRNEVIQDLVLDMNLAGLVGPVQTLVSVMNTAANKLDWYIEPRVDVRSERLDTGEWLLTMDVTVTNPDGIETSDYIDGLKPELAGGIHRALLMVMVPQYTSYLGISDADPLAMARMTDGGRDGFSTVFGTRFLVERGDTRVVQVTFRQPAERAGLWVAPSARAHPVAWTVDGRSYDDAAGFFAPFAGAPAGSDAGWPLIVVSVLLLAAVWIGIAIQVRSGGGLAGGFAGRLAGGRLRLRR